MPTLTRIVTLASAGLLLTRAACAQTGTHSVTQRIELPFFAYVGYLPQRLKLDDSLARRAHVRNHIRSVVKLRAQPGAPADTVEYRELDRNGNVTLRVLYPGRQRLLYRYDAQQRLIELRELSSAAPAEEQRRTYDPKQRLFQHYAGAPDQLQLLQSVQRRQVGDTALSVAEFSAPLPLGSVSVKRIETRTYPWKRDTLRIDMLAFDAAGRPVDYFGIYDIRRGGLTIETGDVSFAEALRAPTPAVTRLRSQGLSDDAITAQLYRQWRAEYQPRQYNFFDAQQRLVRTEALKRAGQPVIKIQNNGAPPVNMRKVGAQASLAVFERAKDGRLLRQEDRVFGGEPPLPPERVYYTEFKYDSQGLLEAETGNRQGSPNTPYTYHYTRY